MPTALSLVGFHELGRALRYFRALCSSGLQPTHVTRPLECRKTETRSPIPNAGNPEIQDFPPGNEAYLDTVVQNPRYKGTATPGASFKLVAIDPLLAFQVQITPERAGG
jgi:hypothetical protein